MGMFNPGWFRRLRDTEAGAGATVGAAAPVVGAARPVPPPAGDVVWVIYASQTGVAEHHARETCGRLLEAGVDTRLAGFDAIDLAALEVADRALFVVSTCGDGDPPDMAEAFCQEHMHGPARLDRLRYGLLSLGDSYYDEFCAFGRRLQQWLRASRARPLFDTVEVDNEDDAALRHWHDCLGTMAWLRHDGRHLQA